MKKEYKITKDVEGGLKKGMIFKWDKEEQCYTTKQMPWFLTPLIDKKQLNRLLKNGLFKEINPQQLLK